jgi:energy-coupling factor transporter ATP-binding protein EcfA2
MLDRIVRRIMGDVTLEIHPPDIVVKGRRRVEAIRYLIGREANYGLKDLDIAGYRNMLDKYTILLNRLPPGSELKIVKMRVDVSRVIARLANEILNLKATIDVVAEEHVKRRAEAKLRILEQFYDEILSGKPIDRIILIVKLHGEGGSYEEVKHLLDSLEPLITPLVESLAGIRLERPGRQELLNIVKYELGLTRREPAKPILVETGKLSSLLPLPPRKKPELESSRETLPIGVELETGWPVLLPIDLLNKHLIIIGPTGRGKTTLLATIMHGLLSIGNTIVAAIDFKGDLAEMTATPLVNIRRPEQDPVNILIPPPEVSRIDWIISVTDVLSSTLNYQPETITSILSDYVGKRIDSKMVVSDPRLAPLAPLLSLLVGEADYRGLITSLEQNTLYDLSGKGTAYQNTYAGILVHLFKHRMLHENHEGLRLLVIDEAWRITRLRGLLEIVKEGRSRNVGVILAVQNPADIPQEILENANTIIMFGSPNEKYLKQAVEILGVKRTVASKLKYLGVGEAIMINALDPHPIIVGVKPLNRKTILK